MGTESKHVFPLSRQFYEDFMFYYPFGNSPPEDFLQSVSAKDSREPTVLCLGCGDMRSPMFTILNNFGLDGKALDAGFTGVHFVLNDRSASVLARNILFLYLSMLLPDPGSGYERNKWLASVWSLWYNHELQPEHNEMLLSALEELCRWSVSWQEWSKCPLGKVVKFASPATFAGVKKVWCKWQSFSKSVEDMKLGRNHFQLHHMKRLLSLTREAGLKKFIEGDQVLSELSLLYSPEKLATFKEEILDFLIKGSVWAEDVLGIAMASGSNTAVNPTLFEHGNGLYTLHYVSAPYMGFTLSVLYKHAELEKTLGHSHCLLPVSDVCFQSRPVLANCVQQFTMWLQATKNMTTKPSDSSPLSFTFILEDSISMCFSMLHFPDKYPESVLKFDAIYTSNLFDHVSPPALVCNSLPLLKPTGTLFTASFRSPNPDYLQNNFGFSPELSPPLLGMHCIGHDGPYSPAVNHEPKPILILQNKIFIWRNVTSKPLLFNNISESPCAVESLFKSCMETARSGTKVTGSVESFLCVLHQFLRQVQFTIPVHEFLQPLCDKIKSEECLKPHLIQLQTQSLLHDIHMHLTLTEADCPVCRGQPLDTYIQQFTLSLDIDSLNMQPYNPPAFEIHLASFSGDHAIMKSLSVTHSDKLNLTFYMPKLSHYRLLAVEMYQISKQERIFYGPVESLKYSPTYDYVFMKQPARIKEKRRESSLGRILKHIGDAHKFETIISYQTEVQKSELIVQCLQHQQLNLKYHKQELNILYPYAISESKTQIKISKKKRMIYVVVYRESSLIMNEKSTYYINPRNEMTRPLFQCGFDTMEKYYNLQLPYDGPNNPLLDAKQSFAEMFKHALNGERIFTFALPSKRVVGAPDIHVFLYVHNLRFNTVFATPSLDVSYCFLEMKPRHIIRTFMLLIQSLGSTNNIMMKDAQYNVLKKIFKHFSSIIRCPFPRTMNIVLKAIEQHKLWKQLDHAVLFPLYPNTANSKCQKFLNFTNVRKHQPTTMVFEPTQSLGEANICSYCQAPTAPFKCEKCQRASYCSDECKQMHQIFHSLFCIQEKSTSGIAPPNSPIHTTQVPKSCPNSRSDKKVKENSPNTATITLCARCKKPGTIVCQCQQVYYCSKACQTLEQPGHSEKCQQLSSEKQRAKTSNSECVVASSECARCKNPTVILCQCQQVSYCSKECQTLEWPGHREKCQPPPNSMTTGKVPLSSSSAETKEQLNIQTGKPKPHLPQKTSGTTECERCKKPATITCQCKLVSYCSEVCKTLEWPVHSKACRKMADTPKPHMPEKSKGVTDSESPKKVYVAQKCYNCGKTKSSLKQCKCGNALYCSVECQRLHWPQHKTTCTTLRK